MGDHPNSDPSIPAPTPETDVPQSDAGASKPDDGSHVDSAKSVPQPGTGPLAGAVRPASPAKSGPLAARGLGVAKPASPSVSAEDLAKQTPVDGKPKSKKPAGKKHPRSGGNAKSDSRGAASTSDENLEGKSPRPPKPGRVMVPNRREGLSDDLQAELDAQLGGADIDIDAILGGQAGMADRKEPLAENARVQGVVLKVHSDHVFISLGGPDEGMVPFEQFTEEPVVGSTVEVVVRGFSNEDSLYVLTLPGGAIEVSDWEDIDEGTVVEATVTGANSGGLECKVGGVRGFIPMGQIADYRIEDATEFVDQKFLCVVTESNERRGNLVLSRRAILEREREEKRKEQIEQIEPGASMEGVVRSVKDFGAFVDLGGLDGLIHISKLSWDRVKHPSEVLEVGQKVQVVIEKIDKETGKVGLSYRDLLENPWDTAEAEYTVGSIHTGTVTRIAAFGCFVKLGPGVEGLVHISELANHRVSKVDAFISEGQEVEVKVLSFDRDSQKVALSIKQANAAPVDPSAKPAEEEDEPQREVAVKPVHAGPLKGGNNTDSGGEKFGLRW